MTVRSHIAEVLRQGIWASLSGGWFFDPRASLFANTLHMYLWIVLALLPLILGLSVGTEISWLIGTAYAGGVGGLLLVVKSVAWYLHGVFDAQEPVVVIEDSDDDGPTEEEGMTRSGCAHLTTSGSSRRESTEAGKSLEVDVVEEDPDGGIPLKTLARQDGSGMSASAPGLLNAQTSEAPGLPELIEEEDGAGKTEGGGSRSSRTVRIDPVASFSGAEAAVELHPAPTLQATSSSDGSPSSQQGLLEGYPSSSLREEVGEESVGEEDSELSAGPSGGASAGSGRTGMRRKYSEPSFPESLNTRKARRSSDLDGSASGGGVRRARSSVETRGQPASSMELSQETLEECKMKGTRKSYPSKTSSTDIFLSGQTPRHFSSSRGYGRREERERGLEASSGSLRRVEEDRSEASRRRGSYPSDESTGGGPSSRPDSPPPQRNQFLRYLRLKLDAFRSDTDTQGTLAEESDARADLRSSTPELAWLFSETPPPSPQHPHSPIHTPALLAGESEAEETEETLPQPQRTLKRKGGVRRGTFPAPVEVADIPSSSSQEPALDLKEELKNLLEQIIESHPEALEAIESVRASRLGLPADAEHQFVAAPSARRPRQSRAPRPSPAASAGLGALADILRRSTTHLASSHTDTTEGSVHCFQDSDGTWFTYTFDAEGPGAAQAIGPVAAVREMLSSDSRRERQESGTRQRRRRTSSSSSEDSYLAQLPSSVLHPASASQLVRIPQAGPSSSSAGLGPGWESLGRRHRLFAGPSVVLAGARRSGRSSAHPSLSGRRAHPLLSMMERTLAAAARETDEDAGPPTFSLGASGQFPGIPSASTSGFGGSGSSINRIRFLSTVSQGSNQGVQLQGTSNGSSVQLPGDGPPKTLAPPPPQPKKRTYYSLAPFPKRLTDKTFRLALDRLELLNLVDRNASQLSLGLDCLVGTLVAGLAAAVIQRGLFQDLTLVAFAAVTAGAQFSLLKSVQPDAASPIHGYNWLASYSRPLYFALLCMGVLVWEAVGAGPAWSPVGTAALGGALLFLPFAFTLGLLPQASTFALHICEQLDMVLFGGTAAVSLWSAVYGLGRSVGATALLGALAHAALLLDPSPQSLPFSGVMGLTVAVAYLFSRQSSSPALLRILFKDESSGDDPLPRALRETVRRRAVHDAVSAVFLALLAFGLHSSTLFIALEPYLQPVLGILAASLGLFNHYLLPQLRKQTPWLLFSQPILKSAEHGEYETSGAARLMWWERLLGWSRFLESNVAYPLLLTSALTLFVRNEDSYLSSSVAAWAWRWAGAWMGLRLLRSGYAGPTGLYAPLAGALLAVSFDLALGHSM